MSAAYDLKIKKIAMSEDGLKYALPSEADCTKFIMVSSHVCMLSAPWYHKNTNTLYMLTLFRHSGIDQYCKVKLSPYSTPEALYLG